MIDWAVAAGVAPSPLGLDRTAPTAVIEVPCRAAGIESRATVTAMVVRRDATVLARVAGPPDAATVADVAAALGLTA